MINERSPAAVASVLWVFLLVGILAGQGARAQDFATFEIGDSVAAVIESIRDSGLPIVYSSALIPDDLKITAVPKFVTSLQVVREILAQHDLTIQRVDDLYVVTRLQDVSSESQDGSIIISVRDVVSGLAIEKFKVDGLPRRTSLQTVPGDDRWVAHVPVGNYKLVVSAVGYLPVEERIVVPHAGAVEVAADLAVAPEAIESVVVTASRYEILRELLGSKSFISQRAIQYLPDFGEDPVRAIRRLPGTASGGASAKSFIRGGEEDESAIILNGQRLLDPFHVRNYQSLFSAIDARAIDGVEVYTGGFPARYGDRLSGVILIDTLSPEPERHTELGLSVFNTSLLSSGSVAAGQAQWVFSARRGNLDLVLNPELGEPSYYDVFGEIGVNLSPSSHLSANVLVSNDDVLIITENDPTEREQSDSVVRNTHFWLHWNKDWTDQLTSSTTVSAADFISRRTGFIDDPQKIIGDVSDNRNINVTGIRQNWTYQPLDWHTFTAGWEFQHLTGSYQYASEVDYFGLFRSFATVPVSRQRQFTRNVDGDAISAYLSDRWKISNATVVEIGGRWDKQTYTDIKNDSQISPRFSLAHSLSKNTNLQLSLGRYFQSQGIHELQVEDGGGSFFPAQRADHAIVGVQHHFDGGYSLRAETYWKRLKRLRPRYENLFDPLAVIPELEPDRVRIAPQQARSRGIELSLAYDEPAGLSWWTTYTLASVEDRIDGIRQPRSWDQRHALQAGIGWSNSRWNLGLAANVHSGWPRTALSITPTADPAQQLVTFGQRNAERFDTFGTIDLRASYSAPVRKGEFSVFFEISNATNRENPCCVDFDLNTDTSGALILEQQNDFWLPLLPAIGVLWQF